MGELTKKQIAVAGGLSILSLISFFIILGLTPEYAKYSLIGNSVVVDNSDYYLSATPHTLTEDGYVHFKFTPKLYTGNIAFLLGFPDDKTLINTLEFRKGDNWISIGGKANDFNFDNLKKWFKSNSIPVSKGEQIELRAKITVPRTFGREYQKYYVVIVPEVKSLEQAKLEKQFWVLDPWVDTTIANITQNSPAHLYNTTSTSVRLNCTFNNKYANITSTGFWVIDATNKSEVLNTANTTQTGFSLVNATYTVTLPWNGTFMWRCWAIDNTGAKGESTIRNFTASSKPPTITVTSPLNITYNQSNITIAYTATPYYQSINSYYYDNSSANKTYVAGISENLSAGTRTFFFRANDTLNNTGVANVTFTVAADTTDPAVYLMSPSNSTTQANSTLNLRCNATDAGGIKNLTVYVRNSSGMALVHSETVNFTGQTSADVTFNVTLPYIGSFNWTCNATDMNRRTSTNKTGSTNAFWNVTVTSGTRTITNGDGVAGTLPLFAPITRYQQYVFPTGQTPTSPLYNVTLTAGNVSAILIAKTTQNDVAVACGTDYRVANMTTVLSSASNSTIDTLNSTHTNAGIWCYANFSVPRLPYASFNITIN